jgi:hypothetical protein
MHDMNKVLLAIGLAGSGLLGSGCACAAQDDAPAAPVSGQPGADAGARKSRLHTRLRVIDDARVDLRFYRNRSCPDGDGVIASSSAKVSSGMFRPKNTFLIGIPETPTLEAMKARTGGMLSQAYYREFALAPGQPLALQAGYVSGWRPESFVCRFPVFWFVPEKGSDYEVETEVADGVCRLRLGRIEMSEGKAKVLPVTLTENTDCTKAN